MLVEILRHRDRLDRLLVVVHLAQQEVDPVRPLEPPVAEQLGVVGRDDQRRPVHRAGQPFDLLFAVEHEVAGVLGGLVQRGLGVVGLLVVGAAGDLVILDAEQAADAGLVQVRLEILVIEVEADVAVEIAVVVVAGIAFDGAPDLLGRFGVAGQGGDAAPGAEDRGIDAVLGPRLGEQDAVRVDEEVADAGILQELHRRPSM